jgi:N-acetylglucosamine malate deacetylase 1
VSQKPVSSQNLIADYLRLLGQPLAVPEVSAPALSTELPSRDPSRRCALILSPHPDDECLTGALPLRLLREQNWQIVNVCATLGSNLARRADRKKELASACATLGFACVLPTEEGLFNVTTATRSVDPSEWNEKVEKIKGIIEALLPQAIFFPHAEDGHPTHKGAHFLGMDALAKMPEDFSCAVVLTEYWQPQNAPNAQVGLSKDDSATLMDALSCHAGEMARTGYNKRFPAYLIDNVRRSERVIGKGAKAPAMDFASIYRFGSWIQGRFVPSALNRLIGVGDSLADLFK